MKSSGLHIQVKSAGSQIICLAFVQWNHLVHTFK